MQFIAGRTWGFFHQGLKYAPGAQATRMKSYQTRELIEIEKSVALRLNSILPISHFKWLQHLSEIQLLDCVNVLGCLASQ